MIRGVPAEEDGNDGAWPGGIVAVTLFVEDLAAAKRFYQDVFQLRSSSRTPTRPCSGSARR
jgi:predicted enzyme related to lactoylglutathione lyase